MIKKELSKEIQHKIIEQQTDMFSLGGTENGPQYILPLWVEEGSKICSRKGSTEGKLYPADN